MKLRYWLSILVIIIIIVCASTLCATSTATPPPVIIKAQNNGLKQPVVPVKAPAPAPVKDIGQKCKAGDEYCVYAGVSQATCMATSCVPPPKNGDPCKYTDKNCVKAKAPMVATVQGGGGCVDTSAEKCDPSQQCVHYTCKTAEDAKRMKVTLDKNEMNFTCGKTDTDVFNCKTVGNTTFCGCGWMRPEDNGGKCPDGMVVKKWSGSARCSPRLEHSTLLNSKRGPCTYEAAVQYSFCAMPPPPAES